MTKHRAPLSFDDALSRIAGQVGGFEKMGNRVGRQSRTVRNWGDPDTTEHCPVDCALELDLMFMEHGGTGAPMYEAYAHQLELAELTRHADRHELSRLTSLFAKEGGEAVGALIRASMPDASPADRRAAEVELAQALEVARRLLPHVAGQSPGAGAGVQNSQPP